MPWLFPYFIVGCWVKIIELTLAAKFDHFPDVTKKVRSAEIIAFPKKIYPGSKKSINRKS